MSVGESGDGRNAAEIKGIASSLINRINQAGSSLYDPNWIKASAKPYGGNVNAQYNVLRDKNPNDDYPQIMGMTMSQIMASRNPGIEAAISAYNNWGTDYSNPNGAADNGYYYWNKTSGLGNSTYDPSSYIITLTAGGSTFYRPR
jgi:hypothetical protein